MKYLALTHSAHRIYDMKICSTNDEAEQHIMSYIRNKLNCTDATIKKKFGGFRSNPTATYCFSWEDGTTPDTDLVKSDLFYKKDTNCKEFQSTVYDLDDYDKYLVYEIGHHCGDILSEGVCGCVTAADATAAATDFVDDLKDLLLTEWGYTNKELKVNKLTYEILGANSDVTYKRVVVIDLNNLTVAEDLSDPVNQKEDGEKKEPERKLTPKEISEKAKEDQKIRRLVQRTEQEYKEKLTNVLEKLTPEQMAKFYEMAYFVAKGLVSDAQENDQKSETSNVSNDKSNGSEPTNVN